MVTIIKENSLTYIVMLVILIISLVYGINYYNHVPKALPPQQNEASSSDTVEPNKNLPVTVKKNAAGEWVAFRGEIEDKIFSGLASNTYGWWYLNNGKVDWTYSGEASNDYGPWKVINGKVIEPLWYETFRNNGFSNQKISEYKRIFDSVGIGNFEVLSLTSTDSTSYSLRATPYKSQGILMYAAFFEGELYSINVSGLMNNSQSGVGQETACLYNIEDGGKLGYYDWDGQKITMD